MEAETRNVPFADEAAMAQLAYERWEQSEAESMAEYIYRRRTLDLAALVRQAIEEELNEKERTMIRLRYYENCTGEEIARRCGVHPSTVMRTLRHAEETLHRTLKYAVAYQNGLHDVTAVPLAVREAMAVNAARSRRGETFAQRLCALREGEKLTAANMAAALKMPQARYDLLEAGQTLPDAHELLLVSGFFGVSVDTLLKGGSV